MKRAMRVLQAGDWWIWVLCVYFVVVGGDVLPAAAAYMAGTSGYISLRSACGSGWEVQMMIMPVSRKQLVIARYLRSAGMAVLVGVLYMVRYSVSHVPRVDGYGMLLCGFALLLTAFTLLIGYAAKDPYKTGSWDVMIHILCVFATVMIPLRIGMNPHPLIMQREPLALITGLTWLLAGGAAMVLSLRLSLRLKAWREW